MIWKFDAGLVAQVCDVLKQAAIEEGQWSEKREAPGALAIDFIRAKLNEGRQRVADKWKREHPDENDGATGMLVKDYRGKNAEQEIWKFDAGLVGKICEALKQAAIEEGNGARSGRRRGRSRSSSLGRS